MKLFINEKMAQDGTQTWRILGLKKIDVELVSRIAYVYKYLSTYLIYLIYLIYLPI